MKLEEVKEIVDKLHKLFEEPEYGLYVWHMAVADNVQRLCDGWIGSNKEDEDSNDRWGFKINEEFYKKGSTK
jgi:hypothetical protein